MVGARRRLTRSARTGGRAGPPVDLCLKVRERGNLWSAWAHVRKSALSSSSRETRKQAQTIDTDPAGFVRRLQSDLKAERFVFAKQKGLLEDRTGKDPRPLVVNPVGNRIVQRAVLQILQSDQSAIRAALGTLPSALETEGSVGGRPGRGPSDAVRLIGEAAEIGMTHFARSDIHSFFTNVPVPPLVEYVARETGDEAFASLFRAALAVELENAATPRVREWHHLFPDGKIGVAQGSSLSAFCANVTLAKFDRLLASGETRSVRYIDDFVVLGRSGAAVRKAMDRGEEELARIGLRMWRPEEDPEKASKGLVREGFEFLSYHLDGRQVGIAKAARATLLEKVRADLAAAMRSIEEGRGRPRSPSTPSAANTIAALDRKLWGWANSFGAVTRQEQFEAIDRKVAVLVRDFVEKARRLKQTAVPADASRIHGLALTADVSRLRQLRDADGKCGCASDGG